MTPQLLKIKTSQRKRGEKNKKKGITGVQNKQVY